MEIDTGGTRIALITLLAPLVWGTTYITITEFLPDDRPMFVARAACIPAGVVLVGAGLITQRSRRSRVDIRQLALLSGVQLQPVLPAPDRRDHRLPGGVAASVGGMQPLLVALIGWLLLASRPRRIDIVIGVAAASGWPWS